jgi:SAM-dependent methyltransferase
MTNHPWYNEKAGFFGEHYLKTYTDAGILTEERTQQEVDFLEAVMGLEKGARILDLACGHGRHAVELARRGYKVVGQDLNSFFLEKAKEAAKGARVQVQWIQGDMREILFEREFDAIVNLFTAFGYLETDEEDEKVLRQVAKALKLGGKFVLDVMNREWVMRNYQARDWQEFPDDSVELYDRSFDFATSRSHERRLYIHPDGSKEDHNVVLRYYTLQEVVAMCQRSGLRFREAYGTFAKEPYSLNTQRCIVVAEKS